MKQKHLHRATSFTLERRMSIGVGAFLIGIVFLYTYFVAFSIAFVVEREELVHNTIRLSEEVSRLEREYLAKSGGITESYASSLGLIPVTSKVFVERTTLSFRGTE